MSNLSRITSKASQDWLVFLTQQHRLNLGSRIPNFPNTQHHTAWHLQCREQRHTDQAITRLDLDTNLNKA